MIAIEFPETYPKSALTIVEMYSSNTWMNYESIKCQLHQEVTCDHVMRNHGTHWDLGAGATFCNLLQKGLVAGCPYYLSRTLMGL